jgi:hypothetical protein
MLACSEELREGGVEVGVLLRQAELVLRDEIPDEELVLPELSERAYKHTE